MFVYEEKFRKSDIRPENLTKFLQKLMKSSEKQFRLVRIKRGMQIIR